jgi:hypothetical protein
VPVNSDYKGFPTCQANNDLRSSAAIENVKPTEPAVPTLTLRAKGADSETTNGH